MVLVKFSIDSLGSGTLYASPHLALTCEEISPDLASAKVARRCHMRAYLQRASPTGSLGPVKSVETLEESLSLTLWTVGDHASGDAV